MVGNFASSLAPLIVAGRLAIDGSGHVWVTNFRSNTVTALNIDGSLFGNFALTRVIQLKLGVAIDSSGHVWVTNEVNNNVTALNNAGTLFGNFAPTGSNFIGPVGVAIDSSGSLWVTSQRGGPDGIGAVTELVGVAAPVLTPMVACLTKTTPATVCLP